jgi:hypothetical protein
MNNYEHDQSINGPLQDQIKPKSIPQLEGIFFITLVIALIHAGFIIWDIFTMIPGADKLISFKYPNTIFASAMMNNLYLTLLSVYAGYKEFNRWTGKTKQLEQKIRRIKRGEMIVLFWVILTIIGITIMQIQLIPRLPKELFRTTLQVLGIFFGTYASKKLFDKSMGMVERDDLTNENRELILTHIELNGFITPKQCRELTGISRVQTYRIVHYMIKAGLIKSQGQTNNVKYIRI